MNAAEEKFFTTPMLDNFVSTAVHQSEG